MFFFSASTTTCNMSTCTASADVQLLLLGLRMHTRKGVLKVAYTLPLYTDPHRPSNFAIIHTLSRKKKQCCTTVDVRDLADKHRCNTSIAFHFLLDMREVVFISVAQQHYLVSSKY